MIVPVVAVQELLRLPTDWEPLFKVTVVALVLVCASVNAPVPIADPLLTVSVPLPICVAPDAVLPVPLRMRLPAACLIKAPLPERFPESVTDPLDPEGSNLVSALSVTLGATVTAMLLVCKSSDGFAVWFGLKVSVWVFAPYVPATAKRILPPSLTDTLPVVGSAPVAPRRSFPLPKTSIPPENEFVPERTRSPEPLP